MSTLKNEVEGGRIYSNKVRTVLNAFFVILHTSLACCSFTVHTNLLHQLKIVFTTKFKAD